MKKTFLFVMVEGGGNVPAQLSVARRLALLGHDVHVLSDGAAESQIAAAGCHFSAFRRAPQHNMRDPAADLIRDFESGSPLEQLRRVGELLMFGPAEAYARDVLDAVARISPDALAIDCLPLGAQVGAEKSGVPSALMFHMPYSAPVPGATPFGLGLRPARSWLGRLRDRVLLGVFERVFRSGLPPVNAARVALGLAPLSAVFDQFHRLDRTLVLTSREFDFVPSGLPANVRYVGPQLDDPGWVEPWASPWSEEQADAPLVLVSLGSTYQKQEKALASIATALGTLQVRGLVTHGAAVAPSAPGNVAVARSVPHASVLPMASAVVCHDGHGTVMKALACGVPVVVVPFGRDQRDNGARVRVAGAGLTLSPKASPAKIAAAVRRVLDEPAFRRGARQMAAVIARDVAADLAVAELEALAGAGRALRAAA